MSEVDQQPECARQWRALSRALIVAGATVAGTSAVWLAGAAAVADTAADSLPAGGPERAAVSHPSTALAERLVADTAPLLTTDSASPIGLAVSADSATPNDSASPNDSATPVGSAPSTGLAIPTGLALPDGSALTGPASAESSTPPDPATFRLDDLDQQALLAEPSRPRGDRAEAAPPASHAAQLGDVLRAGELPLFSVQQVVPAAGGHDARFERLPAVLSGLDGLAPALRHVATTAPDPSGAAPGVVDPPHVDDTPHLQPGPAARAASSGPASSTAAEDRAAHASPEHLDGHVTCTEPRATSASPPSDNSISAHSAATGCSWDTDWPGSTAALQDSRHGDEQREGTVRAGVARNPGAPTRACEDQPGTTPD